MSGVKRAIFPAAGLGTRFLPATKAMPKEMLPLVDKPLIQYAVEEAVASGVEDIVIVTGRGKGAMEDHFDHAYELEDILQKRGKWVALEQVQRLNNLARIAYVRQTDALGLGHAVLTARPLIPPGEPAAVLLADDVMVADDPVIGQLAAAYDEYQAPVIAAMEVPSDQTSRYGIFEVEPVEGRDDLLRVVDMVEKPPAGKAPSNLAAIGRYVVTDDVFAALDDTKPGAGGEIQLTDALRQVARDGEVYALKFQGTRYDGGDKLGFLEATVSAALADDELGPGFRAYLRGLDLG